MAQNPLEVVRHCSAPKVQVIDAMLAAALIEERFRWGLQVDERATKENPVRVLKHTQRQFFQFGSAVVGRYQNTAIQISTDRAPRHYRRPRRSAISRSSSRRLRSLPPDAANSSASFRRCLPTMETRRSGRGRPVFLAVAFDDFNITPIYRPPR